MSVQAKKLMISGMLGALDLESRLVDNSPSSFIITNRDDPCTDWPVYDVKKNKNRRHRWHNGAFGKSKIKRKTS